MAFEPHHFRLCDPIAPLIRMNPEIMNGSGNNLRRFAVDQDGAAGNLDLIPLILSHKKSFSFVDSGNVGERVFFFKLGNGIPGGKILIKCSKYRSGMEL
jgi:hypothetical protein